MNLHFDQTLAEAYKHQTQKIRVMSEDWMSNNGYCPNCYTPITKVRNNEPVKDFFCPSCHEEFELKSKQRSIGSIINDGAYQTMIEKIEARSNPNFFFLSYHKSDYRIRQLMIAPKHFFTADMIIPRKPLPPTAKRAGWVGCGINIRFLPESGKILLIDNNMIVPPEKVRQQWRANLFLKEQTSDKKGWLLAVMRCLDKLPAQFDLKQVYAFESELQKQFQNNKHIQAKIRQQLQILRDQNIIEFSARGKYRKIS